MHLFSSHSQEKSTPLYTDDLPKKKKGLGSFFCMAYGFADRHPRLRYLPAFFLPVILLFFTYAVLQIFPFGDRSVLVLDLNSQYVFFFEALRDWVYGEGSLLYSFSRSLGGEFLGMYAYYLASPLSYLVALFPKSAILEALMIMFLIKAGFSGLNCAIYLRKSVKTTWTTTVLFSTMYAMCGYAIVMHHNTMWMDCFALLPLLSLAIERLIVHGKYRSLVVYLTIMLMSNFYIGFMVCIYCLLYFFFAYFRFTKEERNPDGLRFHLFRRLMRMGVFSGISLLISSLILIPAYYSLTFGKTSFSTPTWDFSVEFPIFNLFTKFLFGSYDTVRYEGIPLVYCGVIVLLLVPLFFIGRSASRREKICVGVLVSVFLASFSLHYFDLIWHGFQKPNWLNFRYAFMLVFILLTVAAKTLDRIKEIKTKSVLILGGILIVATLFSLSLSLDYVDPWLTVAASILFLVIYTALLAFYTRPLSLKWQRTVSVSLVALLITEIYLGSIFHLAKLDEDVTISGHSAYLDYLERWQGEVDYIKDTDPDFYRMERTNYRKRNDSYALGYRGIAGSTSTLNSDTLAYLSGIGYQAQSHWSRFCFPNPVADALTGIRYTLGTTASRMPAVYTEYHTDTDIVSYKNPYALSLAYVVDNDIEHITLSPREPSDVAAMSTAVASSLFGTPFSSLALIRNAAAENYNANVSPFERLNAYVSALLGEEVKLFYPVEATVTTENAKEQTNFIHYYKYQVIDKYDENGNRKNSWVRFTVNGVGEDDIFCYFPSAYSNQVHLYLNDVYQSAYFTEGNYGTFLVGSMKEEESATVALMIDNDSDYIYISKNTQTGDLVHTFYALDTDLYRDVFTRLAEGNYRIERAEEDFFDGKITTKEKDATVLTTIPYDKGWIVEVDGKEVDTYETVDALLTFRIESEGEHQLTLRYFPHVYKTAITLFVIGLVLFNGIMLTEWLVCRKKKQNKNALSKGN